MAPRPLVICGPSGVGKSTIVGRLTAEFPDAFGFSVSHTTRQPRPGEVDGLDYFFVQRHQMQRAIEQGRFIEHAEFSGNLYGTSYESVRKVLDAGKICILDIEVEGVKQVKKSDLDALFVFIRPPSMAELERRLRDRNTETEDSIQKRLASAARELEYSQTAGAFDLVIVNQDAAEAARALKLFMLPFIEQLQQ